MYLRPLHRHCERSEAIHLSSRGETGLLRFARNDGTGLVAVQGNYLRPRGMQNGIAPRLALATMSRLTSPQREALAEILYDPHRRWRLFARDQYFRADQSDL